MADNKEKPKQDEKLKQDTFTMKELRQKFSIAAGFIATDESLKTALKKIINDKITDTNQMMEILKDTNWYTKYTDDYKMYKLAKETNPAVFAKNLAQQKQVVLQQALELGVEISDDDAEKWANQQLIGSKMKADGTVKLFDAKWLSSKMAAAIDFSKTRTLGDIKVPEFSGSLNATVDKLYLQARDYGIDTTMSNSSFQSWMKTTLTGLVGGTLTDSDVNKNVQEMAANNFPGFSEQIRKGYTLREVAAPQINAIAKELELDESTFDLNDNLIQKVLNGAEKPMTAYEARKAARQDSRWQLTENAKGEYKSIGSKILADFGFGA